MEGRTVNGNPSISVTYDWPWRSFQAPYPGLSGGVFEAAGWGGSQSRIGITI